MPASKKKVVSIMNNKQAIDFDSRYVNYDPMTLIVGHKKDVLAALSSRTVCKVNGRVIATSNLDGEITSELYDTILMDRKLLQLDVDRKDDYRLVFFK